MLNFTVNDKRCTRCGLCQSDCVARIIQQAGDALPQIPADKEALCIQCQHCLAVCPTGAISILGKNPGGSIPLTSGHFPTLEQMSFLMRGRRSIRHYKDQNVDPALISQLLATLANGPTGVNRHELTFTVIDDKAVMQSLREKTMAALDEAQKANRIPASLAYLANVVTPYFKHGADIMFRGAPHALIVSAPPDAPCPQEDVALTLAYFDLLAQSAGLGSVWWGMLKMALLAVPELKPLFGIPPDHVYYAMLFGIPTIRFARTVQRDEAAVIRRLYCGSHETEGKATRQEDHGVPRNPFSSRGS